MFVNKINVTKTKRPIKRNEKKNKNQDIKLVHINKKSYIKKNVRKERKKRLRLVDPGSFGENNSYATSIGNRLTPHASGQINRGPTNSNTLLMKLRYSPVCHFLCRRRTHISDVCLLNTIKFQQKNQCENVAFAFFFRFTFLE